MHEAIKDEPNEVQSAGVDEKFQDPLKVGFMFWYETESTFLFGQVSLLRYGIPTYVMSDKHRY